MKGEGGRLALTTDEQTHRRCCLNTGFAAMLAKRKYFNIWFSVGL